VQEIFYRWVQPSRDAADGAICVGTCAVYRRSALAAAGGFAQIGHSEDVHTGMTLLRHGYRLRYVPVLVARGICPDTVEGFLSQQYRWCAGSMSLLVDRGFHNAGLSLRQRLCFWTGFLYYITTAVSLFTGPAAAAALLWLMAAQISPRTYLPLVALTWLTFWMWNRITCARWDLAVVRVQLLYSAAHALAIWHTARGHTADWVPSGAAARGVPLATSVRRLLAGWLSLFLVLVWAGVARAVVVHGWERFWLSCCLAALASVVMVPVVRLCLRPELPPRVAPPRAGRARGRHAAPAAADLADDRRLARHREDAAEAAPDAARRPPEASGAAASPPRRRGRPDHVTWPEVAALAAGYGLLLLVCAGLADPMLP
jgi:cellulose synthase (UDP-forming)